MMMITMMMVIPYLLLCEGAEPLGVGGPLMAEHHHTLTRLGG